MPEVTPEQNIALKIRQRLPDAQRRILSVTKDMIGSAAAAQPLRGLLIKSTAESIERDPPRREYLLTVPAG